MLLTRPASFSMGLGYMAGDISCSRSPTEVAVEYLGSVSIMASVPCGRPNFRAGVSGGQGCPVEYLAPTQPNIIQQRNDASSQTPPQLSPCGSGWRRGGGHGASHLVLSGGRVPSLTQAGFLHLGNLRKELED